MTEARRRRGPGAVILAAFLAGCAAAGNGIGDEPAPAPPELPPPSMRAPADAPDSTTTELPAGTVGAVPDVRALWVVRTSLVHRDSARAAVRRKLPP